MKKFGTSLFLLAFGWFAAGAGAFHAAGADLPKRIVSLSPNMTEILYGIGAFNTVVGVSDYCTYPPEVARLPSVGGWHTPSLEKLTAMRPDLVIVDAAQAPFVIDKLRDLGLSTLVVPNGSIDDVYRSIGLLGRTTGHPAEARKLEEQTRAGLQRVARRVAAAPKPTVALIVSRTPGTLQDLYTATRGGYLAELIEIAGGKIVAPEAANGYGKLSKEDLLAQNPAVIIDVIHDQRRDPKSRFSGDPVDAWREMPELKAVRANRVYGPTDDFIPHASQRIVLTAELFARLIHPELRF
jgi:iron complex transport system substrate-binding protein